MLAHLNIGRRFLPAALALALSAVSVTQTPSVASTQLQQAAKEISTGELQQAEKNLETVLRSSPDDYRAVDLLGVIRVLQHNEASAQEMFIRVIHANPNFAPGHAHLGLLYLRMNRTQDAVPELREALRLNPARADAADALVHILRDQAQAASQQGNLDGAMTLLIEARRYAPDNPDVLYQFGLVALKRSLLEDAIQAFQKTLLVRRDDPFAVFYLGYAWMDEGKFEDARREFARYVNLRPDDPSGFGALGMTLAGLGKPEEARPQFERSIALDPKQSESYYQLGLLDLDGGDYASATQNFQHALQAKPNDASTLAALGRVEFEEKHYTDAITQLRQAVDQDDSLQEAHYYLGLTFARVGRKSDSDEQLGIAARLEEDRKARGRHMLRLREPDGSSPLQK